MSERIADGRRPVALTMTQRRLLNEFQRDFPLVPAPYEAIGDRLGLREDEVIDRLSALRDAGYISRIGAVVAAGRAGAGTLAAMAVPADRLAEVAGLVSSYPEVNHNYEREHRFNLWFVVVAATEAEVARVLAEIEKRTGIGVLDLPLLDAYHIDLGFSLVWE